MKRITDQVEIILALAEQTHEFFEAEVTVLVRREEGRQSFFLRRQSEKDTEKNINRSSKLEQHDEIDF